MKILYIMIGVVLGMSLTGIAQNKPTAPTTSTKKEAQPDPAVKPQSSPSKTPETKASPDIGKQSPSPATPSTTPSTTADPSDEEDTRNEVITKTRAYTEKEAIDIVKRAEEIRAVDNAETHVSLRTVALKIDSTYLMDVKRGVGRQALVDFLAPPEESGRRMLIIKDSYWAKFPDSRKIHPISRREMLGNSVFAVVDLFQMDVVEEYKALIEGETKMRGHDCYKLILNSRHDQTVYKKIEYYIAKKDNFPVMARFYAESGRLLKTLFLTGRRQLAGKIRPDAFTMVDNVTRGKKSYWKTIRMDLADIPDSIFRRSYLLEKN